MMYAKRRHMPLDVAYWIDTDVKIRRTTVSSGLMPDTTRPNVFLSRKFYADLTNLSYERHHKLARCDYKKYTFLKNQQNKAEKTMPGLLPYIEKFTNDDDQLSSRMTLNKIDQSISLAFQSPSSRSINTKSNSTSSQKKQFDKKKKLPKISHRPQISLERMDHLAQPKRRPLNSITNNHIRSNVTKEITAEDLFGHFDNISDQTSVLLNEPKTTTDDMRFRQLIHLFSDVHERKPGAVQSVKSIIQSNPSLQSTVKQMERTDTPIHDTNEVEDHISEQEEPVKVYDDSICSETEMSFTDTYV